VTSLSILRHCHTKKRKEEKNQKKTDEAVGPGHLVIVVIMGLKSIPCVQVT